MALIDTNGLNRRIANEGITFLHTLLPGGKMVGKVFQAGNVRGDAGESLKVNPETGSWRDWAGDENVDYGTDFISLYAACEGIKQGEAIRQLADRYSYDVPLSEPSVAVATLPDPEPPTGEQPIPPTDAPPPVAEGAELYAYRNTDGSPLFWVARWDDASGKRIRPYVWGGAGWKQGGYPAPRPIYGLELLAANPGKPVMIVEGERCANRAREILGEYYVVITWCGGASATSKTDWASLYGRQIVIWPDADGPGWKAAASIGLYLIAKCEYIKVIDSSDQPDGWDVCDAIAKGWKWDDIRAWAKSRATAFVRGWQAQVVPGPEPAPTPELPTPEPAVIPEPVVVVDDEGFAWPASVQQAIDECGLISKKDVPYCNMDNVMRVLEKWRSFKGRDIAWYDRFHSKIFTQFNDQPPREWADHDCEEWVLILQRAFGMKDINVTDVGHAISVYARRRARSEPQDWLKSLQWDGEKRVDRYFAYYGRTEDTPYHTAVSRNWWLGIVARILRPGCQLDNMVYLIGHQGLRKTSSLRIIGGKWFAEAGESITSKDFFVCLRGKLIIEISELDSFGRADQSRIKAVTSRTYDTYRDPYARLASDHQRMCVFVATTNQHRPLVDTTGARRNWPVRVQARMLVEKLEQDRDQLYAEAAYRLINDKETWHEVPAIETHLIQESHRAEDVWEDLISTFLETRTSTTMFEVAAHIDIRPSDLDQATQRRLGAALRVLGWTSKVVRDGYRTTRMWVRDEAAEEDEPGSDG